MIKAAAALAVILAMTGCSSEVAPPVATATLDSSKLLQTYDASCEPCHGGALGGAPKTGDADDWQRRIEKGMAKVRRNAIEGFEGGTGVMPAKGGRPDLTDEDIDSIVDYMVRAAGLPAE